MCAQLVSKFPSKNLITQLYSTAIEALDRSMPDSHWYGVMSFLELFGDWLTGGNFVLSHQSISKSLGTHNDCPASK